jgi:cytochrome bd ubiquinol oxidase subunit I
MLLMSLVGLILRKRDRLYRARWFQRWVLCMGPSGIVALLAGWITTEAGRQPWTVYGVLRTVDSASPLDAQQVGTSLLTFVVVYFLVFGLGVYYMLKLMKKGPTSSDAHAPTRPDVHPAFECNAMYRPDDPIDE